jgi:uncharacterized repeat protein (TIGR03806 family)
MANGSRRVALVLLLAAACGDGGSAIADGTDTDGSEPETSSTGGEESPPIELPPRPNVRSCFFEGNPPGLLPQLVLEPAFEGLSFDAPIAIASAAGRPHTLWVAERDGRILAFDEGEVLPEPRTVVDLGLGPTTTLDAVAFAPDFEQSGHVFVRTHRHTAPAATTVARLTLDPGDEWLADATMTVLTVSFAEGARTGGAMLFDDTGMLIVALGDGGRMDDLPATAQDPSTRHGTILRIDPTPLDDTGTYAIPPDNPRAGDPEGTSAEAWAWGLRDPRHCSHDPVDGRLWCGDVGELQQEVGLAPSGGNLGWPILEGSRCRATPAECETLDAVTPRSSYDHSAGDCEVVGGLVYRGSANEALWGAYLYADVCSGRVRALRLRADGRVEHDELLARLEGTPVAFGEASDGEIYLVDGAEGTLWRIGVAQSSRPFPVELSASGCFERLETLAPAPDLVPFEVNAPLWSDGTLKPRHIVLPPQQTITVEDDGTLVFPVDTYLLKTFVLERVTGDPDSRIPVETRVMIRREHTWEFHSYRWNDDGTEATLLSGGARATFSVRGDQGEHELEYVFPDRFACRACHGSAPSQALGPRVDQLDRRIELEHGHYDQLEQLQAIGLFDRSPPGLSPMTDPSDATAPLEARARAYLHANCAHCHRPGGWIPPGLDMDLRWSRTFAETRTCDVPPQYFNPWADGSLRIHPGEPDDSLLWQRIDQRGPGQMPPLGTTIADPDADVVRAWIADLEACD